MSACHHECCCYIVLETKSTLTSAPISTGQILPCGIDCQIKGCYYFEQILPEGVPKRLKYFTALLTLCEGWSPHSLSCSTECTSKRYQFDGENEYLAIVLLTSFTAIIFCVASSIPLFSSGVYLFFMSSRSFLSLGYNLAICVLFPPFKFIIYLTCFWLFKNVHIHHFLY